MYLAARFAEFDMEDEQKELIKKLKEAKDREELEHALGLYKKFEENNRSYGNSKTKEEEKGYIVTEYKVDINSALAYYYLHSFAYQGHEPSVSEIKTENMKSFKDSDR